MTNSINFSEEICCPYCNNSAPMKELSATVIKKVNQEIHDAYLDDLTITQYWQILECPACRKNTLREGYFNDHFSDEGIIYKIIFPLSNNKNFNLPNAIRAAYNAAQKVKYIDSNAFAVLLGRLLDTICEDKKARGKTLFDRINDLATKSIIPDQVAKLAFGLKDFRNIGAHANLGSLSQAEIPIIEEITEIILDYVYNTPMLIENVKAKIKILKIST